MLGTVFVVNDAKWLFLSLFSSPVFRLGTHLYLANERSRVFRSSSEDLRHVLFLFEHINRISGSIFGRNKQFFSKFVSKSGEVDMTEPVLDFAAAEDSFSDLNFTLSIYHSQKISIHKEEIANIEIDSIGNILKKRKQIDQRLKDYFLFGVMKTASSLST